MLYEIIKNLCENDDIEILSLKASSCGYLVVINEYIISIENRQHDMDILQAKCYKSGVFIDIDGNRVHSLHLESKTGWLNDLMYTWKIDLKEPESLQRLRSILISPAGERNEAIQSHSLLGRVYTVATGLDTPTKQTRTATQGP